MATARFPLALLILVSVVTPSCTARLPSSAESLLLRRLHAQKLITVHDVRRRTIDRFDYLGVFATFEGPWKFEAWYHPEVILRKQRSDPDWRHAELFRSQQRLVDLFALPDAEFQRALISWPTD